MNKLFAGFILMLLSPLFVCARQVSFIEGIWQRGNTQTIRLYGIQNGEMTEIASSRLNADKEFYLAFVAEREGFYAIGTQKTQPKDRYLFYFKPGDNLCVRITNDGFLLVGENTPENRELEKWQAIVNPLEAESIYRKTSGMTYKEFFPMLEGQVEKAKSYPVVSTGNEVFDKAFEDYRKLSVLDPALLFFLYAPKSPARCK